MNLEEALQLLNSGQFQNGLKISLHQQKISDVGAKALARALESGGSLEMSPIDPECALALARVLASGRSLEALAEALPASAPQEPSARSILG